MTADVASRIARVAGGDGRGGVDALVVTPGSDLRYLTGYDAIPLERLTALVVPVEGDPALVVPLLEAGRGQRSPAALAGMQVVTHGETDDAYALALGPLQDCGQRGRRRPHVGDPGVPASAGAAATPSSGPRAS